MITTPSGNPPDHPQPSLGNAGPFRLDCIIAEGGAGIVYRGVQEVPLRRIAAIKVLRDGIASRHIRQRFDAERQALAEMHHPNVESIFDAGTTDDGRPWFAMPFIDGSPITTHCDDDQLTLGERLTLFLEVCAGVSHAHSKGIIHRDLKPSNVLVARSEVVSTAKVIDFGIAKFREIDRATDMDMTVHGAFLGTLAYASPEQATLGAAHADARSDVFALGALLHELLCGMTHLAVDPSRATLHDLSTFEPTRMSVRVADLARTDPQRLDRLAIRRSTTPVGLERSLRGDLDAIVMTALDPESSRRYGTVDALAEDIRRMLDGRPVEATPPTRLYLLSRFARRHRVETGAAAAIIVVVVSALATLSWMLLREHALTTELEHALCLSSLAAADGALALGEHSGAQSALLHAPPSQRAFEWNYRMRLTDASALTSKTADAAPYCIRHSPDGAFIATTDGDGFAIYDAETFARVRSLRFPTEGDPRDAPQRESWWVSWSPDGTRITGGRDLGLVGVWLAESGENIAVLNDPDGVSIGSFVDEHTIALGNALGAVSLVDLSTLSPRITTTQGLGERIYSIVRRGSGPLIVASLASVAALDPSTLATLWRVKTDADIVSAAIDPKGERIAVTHRASRPMTIHSALDGTLLATVANAHSAWNACWSPQGEILWTAGFDQRVLALDGTTYALKRALGGSRCQVWSISSVDEHHAVSGDQCRELRRWDLHAIHGRHRLPLSTVPLTDCAFSSDGQVAFVIDRGGALFCVDLASAKVVWSRPRRRTIAALQMVAGTGVLVVETDGALSLLSPDDGSVIEETPPSEWCSRAVIAHDGSFIAVLRGAELICIELPSGAVRWSARISEGTADALEIAPDDQMIASVARGRKPELFQCSDGTAHRLEKVGGHSEACLAFSSDGESIWTCTQESHCEAAAQDRVTGESTLSFAALSSAAVSLTLADRAPRAAVRSRTGITKIFEPGHDDDLLTLHSDEVKARPVFAPDADRLLFLRDDGVLEIVDGSPVSVK